MSMVGLRSIVAEAISGSEAPKGRGASVLQV